MNFKMDAKLPQDVGLHVIVLTATIPQPSENLGLKKVSTSFELTVLSDCVITEFVSRPISKMVTQVM